MGQNHGHETRVRSAVTNHSCHVPVISGVKKTHKPLVPGQPVPVRPIAGADEANNQQISQILADIVVAVTKIMDPRMAGAICRSSEEMMAAMTEVNELQDTKNLVILSTDISAMFTSMDIAECAKIAADMFFESGMELNIDTEELFKLLDLDQVARGSSRHQHQEDPGQRHQDQVNLTRTRPVSSSESRSRFSSKLRCRSTCTALKET